MSAGSRTIGERLRWRIVCLLDKSPRFCRADLVSWALDGWRSNAAEDGLRHFTSALSSRTCQTDGAEPGGTCYCGKFRDIRYDHDGTGA